MHAGFHAVCGDRLAQRRFQVIAACDVPRPTDCLAGAAGALVQVLGRTELASGLGQALGQGRAAPGGANEAT